MKKVAVITGASSGMGREIARQISEKIPSIEEIWLMSRRRDRLEEISSELQVPCVIIDGDLNDDKTIHRYDEMLQNSNVNVKMLVNASGYGMMGNVSEIDLRDNTGMVRLNCEALTAITRITIPYMSRKSRIINFASSAAFVPQPGFAVYAASKSYVLSFSRALNQELKHNEIYVTAVCPGPVNTEFFELAERYHKRAWYKKFFMADCSRVVEKALRDSVHRKELSIYGVGMKALCVISKVIPMSVILGALSILNKNR